MTLRSVFSRFMILQNGVAGGLIVTGMDFLFFLDAERGLVLGADLAGDADIVGESLGAQHLGKELRLVDQPHAGHDADLFRPDFLGEIDDLLHAGDLSVGLGFHMGRRAEHVGNHGVVFINFADFLYLLIGGRDRGTEVGIVPVLEIAVVNAAGAAAEAAVGFLHAYTSLPYFVNA